MPGALRNLLPMIAGFGAIAAVFYFFVFVVLKSKERKGKKAEVYLLELDGSAVISERFDGAESHSLCFDDNSAHLYHVFQDKNKAMGHVKINYSTIQRIDILIDDRVIITNPRENPLTEAELETQVQGFLTPEPNVKSVLLHSISLRVHHDTGVIQWYTLNSKLTVNSDKNNQLNITLCYKPVTDCFLKISALAFAK